MTKHPKAPSAALLENSLLFYIGAIFVDAVFTIFRVNSSLEGLFMTEYWANGFKAACIGVCLLELMKAFIAHEENRVEVKMPETPAEDKEVLNAIVKD